MKVNKLISPKGAFAPKDNYTPPRSDYRANAEKFVVLIITHTHQFNMSV